MIGNVIQGNDVIFSVHNGEAYVPFVCAKDLTIETSTAMVNVTTKGDGFWDKFRPQSLGYTISLSGVMKWDADGFTGFDMMDHQTNFVAIMYKMVFRDKEDENIKIYKGSCYVERSSISGNTGQLSLSDFSLRGTGAVVVASCQVQIGTVTILSGSGNVLVGGMTPEDAVSFIWQLDNGDENETSDNPFDIGDVPDGYHTIIITPVCEDALRGEEFTHDFSVLTPVDPGVGENPQCRKVHSLVASDIIPTEFTLNFTNAPPVNHAESFRIVVRNVATGLTFTVITYTTTARITGLIAGTEYDVSVVTECGPFYGESVSSNHIFVTTTGGAMPHPPPTGLVASDITSSTFRLTWDAIPGAYEYELYVQETATGLATTINTSLTTYTFSGWPADTEHYVRLTVIFTDGARSSSIFTYFTTLP